MIAEITLSHIVSIVISKDKGDDDQSFRVITLVDKEGKEHTVNVFGVFGGELPISL
jgi:riboflavin synthase